MTKSWLAAQGKLPLSFMVLSLVWIAVASGLLVVKSGLLGGAHWTPELIAVTHSWVLGFFATVACGAVYQLVPVALSTTLWSEKLGWLHFWLHLLGVPGMVISLWGYRLSWVLGFGGAVIAGVLIFALNTWITIGRSKRRDVIATGIGLATVWLVVTVLMGLFLTLNRRFGLVLTNPLALLRAHAHMGLVGFFVVLIQGVGFQLVPMFTMGQVRQWRAAWFGLWAVQLGLGGLVTGLIGELWWLNAAGAALITAGLLGTAWGLKVAIATRKKKKFDPGVVVFLRGGVGLIVTAAVGVALAIVGPDAWAKTEGFAPMVYVCLGIFGGLLPCVAGMMCKVVPFLTWMRCYGPLVGRVKTPPAHSLTHPKLELWALGLQQAATLPLVVGVWVGRPSLLLVGAVILAVGVALFLGEMFGVFRHLGAPVVTKDSPPLFPVKPKQEE